MGRDAMLTPATKGVPAQHPMMHATRKFQLATSKNDENACKFVAWLTRDILAMWATNAVRVDESLVHGGLLSLLSH
jgi:hypothetical protein